MGANKLKTNESAVIKEIIFLFIRGSNIQIFHTIVKIIGFFRPPLDFGILP